MSDEDDALKNARVTRRALGVTVGSMAALALSACTRVALDGPGGTIIVDTEPYPYPSGQRRRRRAHDDDDDDDSY